MLYTLHNKYLDNFVFIVCNFFVTVTITVATLDSIWIESKVIQMHWLHLYIFSLFFFPLFYFMLLTHHVHFTNYLLWIPFTLSSIFTHMMTLPACLPAVNVASQIAHLAFCRKIQNVFNWFDNQNDDDVFLLLLLFLFVAIESIIFSSYLWCYVFLAIVGLYFSK